jgi:quinol monooxygenase YgiN
MVVIHAEFPIDPDRREEALDVVRTLVEATQQEDGVIEYRAATDVSDPNLVRFVERYEDGDAFVAHTESEHFATFEEQLPDFLAGEPTVMRFDVRSAIELDL